ncbi:MAG: hypothetical protein IKI76_01250 [Selenomonadaceae bacterium]|nr:hypothetical protein [Selenomonadaceae bacterium]
MMARKFLSNKIVRRVLEVIGLFVLIGLVGKVLPTLAGVVLCLVLLGGYYGVIYRSLKLCKVNFRDELLDDLPRILIVAALSVGFIIFMVSSQQTIYIWDSLETWEPTIDCDETTFSDPHQALKNLRGSINHSDYNNFLPMLMTLPMHLFGKSFLCYALYVWLMFALPAVFIAAATLKHFANVNLPCSAIMAILLSFPVFEVPLLVGYANVSIILPAAIILALLLSLDESEPPREPLILIAVLCIFAVFQARTAAYMILGEFVGYAVYVLLSGGNLLRLCQRMFVIAAYGSLIALPLFFTFFKRALTYNIGAAYSAYQRGMDFSERLLNHAEFLGFLIYAFFIVGVLVSFRNKKLRPLAACLLTWTINSVWLICRIQLMGWQHYCIMILPFAFAIVLLINFALSKKKSVGAALIAILAFNCLQTYSFNLSKPFNTGYTIPIRHDIDELKVFVADLNQLAGDDKKIYLLASGELYNGTILDKIYMPNNREALPGLMGGADVDLRDGFPVKFFDADIILVAEPVQTHLLPENQLVVVKPAELMLRPSPISKHFKQIKTYTFHPESDGVSSVTFKVYEKISPFEREDIDFVEKIFAELYPNQDELFKDRFETYKQEHFEGQS